MLRIPSEVQKEPGALWNGVSGDVSVSVLPAFVVKVPAASG